MRVLLAKNYIRMPWKNGGGETVEIAIAPAGASLEDFVWRISMAKVPESGPFSSFPAVDRTLAVLNGEMIVHVEDRADVRLDALSNPYCFPGDVPTRATVLKPVIDLNIMTRRGVCSAHLHRVENCGRFEAHDETLLLLQSHAGLKNGETAGRDDALWLERGERIAFSTAPATLWAIALHSESCVRHEIAQ